MEDIEVSEVNDYQSERPRLFHQREQSSSSASLDDDPKSLKVTAKGSEVASDFHLGNANVVISTKNIVKEMKIFN